MPIRVAWLVIPAFLLMACSNEQAGNDVNARWYTQSLAENGRLVFAQHCSECHGKNAEGTADWKKALADGSYPPPPLNGTAHAWHHPLRALMRTVNDGGIHLGGKMPGFKDKLSESEKAEVIAFFQSQWNDQIYSAWLQRGGLK